MIGKDGQGARVTTILRPLAAKVNSRAGVNALEAPWTDIFRNWEYNLVFLIANNS